MDINYNENAENSISGSFLISAERKKELEEKITDISHEVVKGSGRQGSEIIFRTSKLLRQIGEITDNTGELIWAIYMITRHLVKNEVHQSPMKIDRVAQIGAIYQKLGITKERLETLSNGTEQAFEELCRPGDMVVADITDMIIAVSEIAKTPAELAIAVYVIATAFSKVTTPLET